MTLSPDGRFWWDGIGWQPVSPDGQAYWNGLVWVPLRVAPRPPLSLVPPTPSRAGIVLLIGALGLLLGAILPWVSISFGPSSSSGSGTDAGDGWWFIGGAAVVAILGYLVLAGRSAPGVAPAVVVLGLAGGALLGYEFHQAHRLMEVAHTTGPAPFAMDQLIDIHYGAGLWVLAIAVAAVLAGGVMAWTERSQPLRIGVLPIPPPAPAHATYAAFGPDDER